MSIVTTTAAAILRLFGPLADEAARSSGVIQRRRKFSPALLAQTFILGFLYKPRATDEQLAQTAALAGVSLTPQAVEKRHTPRLVQFLQNLFRSAVTIILRGDGALAPLLERFSEVTVLDSTTIALPDSQHQQFPGCGGGRGGGKAALKLQAELDLRSGGLSHIEIEPGRSSDGGSSRQQAKRPAGSLRITDLGYFSVSVFAAIVASGAHFLSRLHYNTSVRTSKEGSALELLRWLSQQPGPWIDAAIFLGPERLACRLIAWRLPPELAAERRRKLRRTLMDKRGLEPSAARLAWCDWTILITSVAVAQLSPKEAAVLYKARWQVELLFKRWKSQGLVAELSGSTDVRQMVRVWSRLLAVLVQQWLIVAGVNGQALRSLTKVAEAARSFVVRLLIVTGDAQQCQRVLEDWQRLVASTCRRNTRKRKGTAELLKSPEALDFRLS